MYDLQALMDQVRHRGCRVTPQRALILQALCELDGHASAERIYQRVILHRRDVDLSTVYRALERLRNLHVVSQTDLGRGCAEYEIVAEHPHHHLVCQNCRRVLDIDHTYVAPVAESIRLDFGFDAVLNHFAIFGLCRDCRAAETRHEDETGGGERQNQLGSVV
jgi:Fur family ferric uptake transcriptional regulator